MTKMKKPTKNTTSSPFKIGAHYLIRTVTMTNTGTLVAEYPEFLVLKDAAWVADTGRFANVLKDPTMFNEVEPFPADVIVGKGAIVDACIIPVYTPLQK